MAPTNRHTWKQLQICMCHVTVVCISVVFCLVWWKGGLYRGLCGGKWMIAYVFIFYSVGNLRKWMKTRLMSTRILHGFCVLLKCHFSLWRRRSQWTDMTTRRLISQQNCSKSNLPSFFFLEMNEKMFNIAPNHHRKIRKNLFPFRK